MSNTQDDNFPDDNFDADFNDAEFDMDFEYDEAQSVEGYNADNSDQEWETQNEEKPVKKKKEKGEGLSFNAKVMIGAFVVGGLFMAYQISKSTKEAESKKPETYTSALQMDGAFDGPGKIQDEDIKSVELKRLQEGKKPEVNTEKGFLFEGQDVDVSELTKTDSEIKDAPPMPEQIVMDNMAANQLPAPNVTVVPVVTPMPTAENAVTPNPPPQETADSPDPLVKSLEAPQPDKPVEQPVPQQSTDGTPLPVVEDEFSPAQPEEEKVEKIVIEAAQAVKDTTVSAVSDVAQNTQEEIGKVSAAVNAVKEDMATVDSISKGEEATYQLLLDKIENISQRLDAIESNMAMMKDKPSSVASSPKKEPEKASKPVVKQKTSTATSVTSKKPAPVKDTNVSWELRAAQPGKAWISKKGDKEMRPVMIGDTLSGVGKVTDINFANGRWVVVGTQGRLTQ